jgi:hypothetical protein
MQLVGRQIWNASSSQQLKNLSTSISKQPLHSRWIEQGPSFPGPNDRCSTERGPPPLSSLAASGRLLRPRHVHCSVHMRGSRSEQMKSWKRVCVGQMESAKKCTTGVYNGWDNTLDGDTDRLGMRRTTSVACPSKSTIVTRVVRW